MATLLARVTRVWDPRRGCGHVEQGAGLAKSRPEALGKCLSLGGGASIKIPLPKKAPVWYSRDNSGGGPQPAASLMHAHSLFLFPGTRRPEGDAAREGIYPDEETLRRGVSGTGAARSGMWRQHLGAGASRSGMWRQHLGAGTSGSGMWRQHLGTGASGSGMWRQHLGAGASGNGMWRQHLGAGASGSGMWRQHLGTGGSRGGMSGLLGTFGGEWPPTACGEGAVGRETGHL